jgi:hypothetical protein
VNTALDGAAFFGLFSLIAAVGIGGWKAVTWIVRTRRAVKRGTRYAGGVIPRSHQSRDSIPILVDRGCIVPVVAPHDPDQCPWPSACVFCLRRRELDALETSWRLPTHDPRSNR